MGWHVGLTRVLHIKHRGKFRSLTDEEKKSLKRRQAIEPIIGHLTAHHRMNRCHFKGSNGDSVHAVLCAAGINIRWLLCMIVKKGTGLFFAPAKGHRCGANGPSIATNLCLNASQIRFAELDRGLKMNFY